MLVINGGMPRSGTVLVGNLVRLMLERRSIAWKRYNPQERRDLPAFLDLVRRPFDTAVIVHTHLVDDEILNALRTRPDAILIWNHRDPRDALVSLRQLHDLSLDRAFEAMQVYCAATEIAHTSAICHRIAYEALVDDLPGYISSLSDALDFTLEEGEIDSLLQQTSPEAHVRIMNALSTGTQKGARVMQTKHRMMREEPTTLINDRHIQSGKSGRWRRELTQQDQQQVSDVLSRWVGMLGYDHEDATGS